jgi:hypothetical protein
VVWVAPNPMINRDVPDCSGALCLEAGCGRPVSTVSQHGAPRFCPEHQPEVNGYPRKTCRECGEKLREPSASGCCGWCEEEGVA